MKVGDIIDFSDNKLFIQELERNEKCHEAFQELLEYIALALGKTGGHKFKLAKLVYPELEGFTLQVDLERCQIKVISKLSD